MTQAQPFDYTYTGKILPESPPPKNRGEKRDPYPYLPSDDLVEAVNLSIALQRPLLLEGDPGCGKTCLAEALVYELEQKNGVEWPFYSWYVKSSSRGKEGLYTYDAVGRLRDAQMLGANLSELQNFLDQENRWQLKLRLKNPRKYLEFGPLGKAIQETEKRAVVLIDEVDKGDSDFANDLLLELDRFEFKVPEISDRESYPQNPDDAPKPIVILTSNREKPLPAPFLRRCLYFYVEFPKGERLQKIVAKRFPGVAKKRENLVTQAIAHVEDVRTMLAKQPGSRPPGTSEFLDFLKVLLEIKSDEELLKVLKADQKNLDVQKLANHPPLLGTLLKTQADQDLHRRKFGGNK